MQNYSNTVDGTAALCITSQTRQMRSINFPYPRHPSLPLINMPSVLEFKPLRTFMHYVRCS